MPEFSTAFRNLYAWLFFLNCKADGNTQQRAFSQLPVNTNYEYNHLCVTAGGEMACVSLSVL